MIITGKTRFLNLPVNCSAEKQKLYFYEDSKLILDLDVQLDAKQPEYICPYDMLSFMGRNIEVCAQNDLSLNYSDDRISFPDDPLRPKIHFTANYGLINDPNGLIFYEGKYHLFFQHNPAGNIMAHMHWGHAVSEDLLCWNYLPDALLPDDMGDMWSGSAIVDKKNLLGLNTNEHEALVLFYTAAGNNREVSAGKQFTQCMAFSVDGGYSFTKYKNNPVVPLIKNQNRDPKVIYDEDSDMYVMALYLDENEYALLKSATLTEWELIRTFILSGTSECPDLFAAYDGRVKKWVFTGANGSYSIGDLDINRGFVNIKGCGRYAFGRIYAAQTWSNVPDRNLRIDVQKTRELPTKYFNSFLTVPYEVSVKNDVLHIKPASEIENAVAVYCEQTNVSLDGYSLAIPGYSTQIKLTLAEVREKVTITLFETEITVDFQEKEILFDDVRMPCHIENAKADIRIIADKICLEIFSADRYVGGKGFIHTNKEKYVRFAGDGKIEKIEIGVY